MNYKSLSFVFFAISANLTAEQNPIFHAIQQNNAALVKNMLQSAQYSNTVNEDEQTILHTAVLANNWKAVKAILKSGQININQLDKHNKTAMDYAVERGYSKMVRKLYKNKGNVTSIENAKYAKKIITRPFKILFGIGIAFLTVTMFWVANYIHLMNPSLIMSAKARGCALAGSAFMATIFGVPAASLLIPAVSGWASRSHKNLSITESIA
jgi:hypothetical protein